MSARRPKFVRRNKKSSAIYHHNRAREQRLRDAARSVLGADVGEWLAREQPSGETVARMVAIILVRSELRIGPDTPLDTTPPVFVALGVDLPEVVAELTAPAKKPAPARKGGKKSAAKGARKKSAKAPKPVTQRKLGKKGGKR